jgi:dTDP-glucose pyrophosphorylase
VTNRLHLILPAAGLGSRFKEVGELRPKPLIPVFELPMILWVLMNFPLNPIDKVWIVSQRCDDLPLHLASYLNKLDLDVEFIEIDGLTEGPASTVSLALKWIPDDDPVVVANTDQFIYEDIGSYLQAVRFGHAPGILLTMLATSNAWSYVGRDPKGKVTHIVEKIEISEEATVGVYGWSRSRHAKESFFDTFSKDLRTNNEFYVAPTYNYLIDNNYSIETVLIGQHGIAVHGLGTPKDLEKFLNRVESKNAAENHMVRLGLAPKN